MAILWQIAYPIYGGMCMTAQDYWKVFLDSGIPEYYLLYNQAKKTEENHVFNHTGTGSSGMSV